MTKSIPALLRNHNLYPRKRLGQNFLTDAVALERIAAAADLSTSDLVVEVGAGAGTLTRAHSADSSLARSGSTATCRAGCSTPSTW